MQEDLDDILFLFSIRNMKISTHIYIVIVIFNLYSVVGKDITFLSSFSFKGYGFGAESLIQDYVTLQNDPKSNLPNSFTICSSLWVQYINSDSQVFQMYKRDGSIWFMLNLATYNRDFVKLSEMIKIHYDNPLTEAQE